MISLWLIRRRFQFGHVTQKWFGRQKIHQAQIFAFLAAIIQKDNRGHTDMTIGLAQFRDPQKLSLPHLLILPFVGDPGRVPINRH